VTIPAINCPTGRHAGIDDDYARQFGLNVYTQRETECRTECGREPFRWMPDDLDDPLDYESAPPGPPQNPHRARIEQLRAALVDTLGLDHIEDPVPLIEGVIFKDSLAWLYGKPGSGKSFVALDWAGCIANGLPWQYREVSRGRVLYLVAEGVSGIRRRVRAWEHAANVSMADVIFLPVAVQLLNGIDLQALVTLVAEMQPVMVVIDTQARVTVGAEENSNGEMSKVVDAADRIRQASAACVLMVHHSGKNGLDMRGASAFEGAATSIIKVGKDGEQWVDVICDKQKDVEDFPPIRLQMTPMLNSVVLTGSTYSTELAASTKTEEKILAAMREAFAYTTASPKELAEVSGISRASVYRALTALTKRGQLVNVGTEKVARYSLPASVRNEEG
jgi:hypothetical protein